MFWQKILLGSIYIACSVYAMADQLDAPLQYLLAARQNQQLTPVISGKYPAINSELQAYQIQTRYVQKILGANKAMGYKAGLTTLGAQQKFSVKGPVAGVLIQPAQDATLFKRISMQPYHRMMLEMELGFRFKQSLLTPVASIEELKVLVAEVMPIIELPDLGFDQPNQLKGVDIIASNVAAKSWLRGKALKHGLLDVNTLTVTLDFNGQKIMQANSGEVMNDQWQALLWLVNRMLANGWRIEPEQILITGAIGAMLPAELGEYKADYSGLGHLAFSITP